MASDSRSVRDATAPRSSGGCVCVGITNSGLNADKRGVAVELARRVQTAVGAPVCLVGADPTDRDVERHLPHLEATDGDYTRTELSRGTHTLRISFLRRHQLCAITMSDRTVVHEVLPDLRDRFRYIVIDGPSRVGNGVGIAHVLLQHLDFLIVTTGSSAGELARARAYVDLLARTAAASHVVVRAVISGHRNESGLSEPQLEQRIGTLPTIGWLPRLWGRTAGHRATEELDGAFRPLVDWIVSRGNPGHVTQRRIAIVAAAWPS